MERKLLTILFVDLVDSTSLVTTADPEVVRRRVGDFLSHARDAVEAHGGTVGRYAGDALIAGFGIPQAHEDDAARAVRAGLAILATVRDLGLQARIGIESGEVLVAEDDVVFATGEAVNVAVRLQQAAAPGELLLGPAVHRLTLGGVETDELGPLELKGLERPVWVWRAVCAVDGVRPRRSEAPFVGREFEIDLLGNTYARLLRDRRAHLFTIYGEPGVGKSRLAQEFLESLEGVTILTGRCLPYGEGITYWPVAEMVKSAAGISDDDPVKEAVDKLRACCEDEVVADLLGLASGVLEAVEAERSQQEIAWAVREWVEQLAQTQPVALVFEDIHWAEEPLLELVEHLAEWVREAPLLLLCLARPELLEVRHGWGGGRTRATSIELEALDPAESNELVDALLAGGELPAAVRVQLLEKTGGNPLFLEETVRMLLEDGDGGVERIPDTVQSLIAARIDRLPFAEKALLQRAAVIGRVFWPGAVAELAREVADVEAAIESLLLREFVAREERSSISGQTAYHFKHVLIREVAYAGLSKTARAELHTRFAEWLAERTGDELLEIRAYHLDQACLLRAELDGEPPAELARITAAALEAAGRRALAREANRSARKLFERAVELEPTLERRYQAARAAWRMTDLPAVSRAMSEVCREAEAAGDVEVQGKALAALAEVALLRDADIAEGARLAEAALELLAADDPARCDALFTRATVGWWRGDLDDSESFTLEALETARRTGREDHEARALLDLAGIYRYRLEPERAEPLVDQALELAEESGSIVARAGAVNARGNQLLMADRLDEAAAAFDEARRLFGEAGAMWLIARSLDSLARVAARQGDLREAERLLREAIRMLTPIEDRGTLCESQRGLAQVLVGLGRAEEAERYALAARETVGAEDATSRATTRVGLAVVRAAQGREEEAHELFREALAIVAATDMRWVELEVLSSFASFLADTGREDAAVGARLEKLAAVAPPGFSPSAVPART